MQDENDYSHVLATSLKGCLPSPTKRQGQAFAEGSLEHPDPKNEKNFATAELAKRRKDRFYGRMTSLDKQRSATVKLADLAVALGQSPRPAAKHAWLG